MGWQGIVALILALASGIVQICIGLLATPMDATLIAAGVAAILAALGISWQGKKILTLKRMLKRP